MRRGLTPLARLTRMHNRVMRILDRDIRRIDNLSIGDKLPDTASKHLVAYTKLLGDLKREQEAIEAASRRLAKEATSLTSDAVLEAALKGE